MAMNAANTNVFSLEQLLALRAEAFAAIRVHGATIQSIAAGIESVDAALQLSIAERTVDDQQVLTLAGRNLKALLETAGAN